jgi:sugar phosphate isomerase/epimerase
MSNFTRKEFLQASTLLLATAITNSSFSIPKKDPLLAFSTLGCPDWTFRQIVDFAALNNYTGIELRGIQRQMELTKRVEFSPQNIQATLALMKEKGLHFVDLGSSANMHLPDGAERDKNLAEAKSYIDLAQQLNCPYVRVFPNEFPKNQEHNKTIETVARTLAVLGDYAKARNVSVVMETHGDFSGTEDVENAMKSANHPNVGLVWDVANMWTITKEPPAEVYQRLKKYIRHTHIKDAKIVDGVVHYVLLGKGEVPIFEAIDLLSKGGYKGYYSFEWEKLWHPEIIEPEIALADYSKAMKQHFK